MNSADPSCEAPVLIALRRRADLVMQQQTNQGETLWVVKDPLSLKYYRFSNEEHLIWSLLDGRTTDVTILKKLQSHFPACSLEVSDIRDFSESLYANNLVVADTASQGQRLSARQQLRRNQRRKQLLFNLLAIRLRGIDLTWLLEILYPWCAWFFRPRTICAVGAIALFAGGIALTHLPLLGKEILAMHENFGPGCWLLLACTLAVTKMLHELGHALACKHCGGECHEIGVMLLVLTPCLYCDVSDSWLLPSKWRRAAIAAAGMYVEVALASIALIIWWSSAPGLLHYLCLQVVLICSVSTVLFNGNPLARYDGYYILADLVEVPNLRQKSRSAVHDLLARVCLGISPKSEPSDSSSPWLLFFGFATIVYRWQLLITILWFLHGFFSERGLEVLWQLLALLTLFSSVAFPLWKAFQFVSSKEIQTQMNRQRVITTASVLGSVSLAFFLIPLPRRVTCTFETRPSRGVPIYATHDARLEELLVVPGQRVVAGQRLANLSNLDLQYEVTRLTNESAAQAFHIKNLKYERFANESAMEVLPQAEESLLSTSEQLHRRSRDLAELTLSSPTSGVIYSTPRREKVPDAKFLPSWSGTPLDPLNEGAVLKAGEVLCEIGDPDQWEAVLVIHESDVEHVRKAQAVRLVLDALPRQTLQGTVEEIAQQKLEHSPESLSIQSGGQLPTHVDRFGKPRPASTSYTARVPIAAVPHSLASGFRGTARIQVGSATLATRLWEYFCRTFCFA